MPESADFAQHVRISLLSSDLVSRKLRVAGRLQSYDPDGNIICIRDGDVSLLVDVSLCLSPFKTYPWLREPNTVVMALGYLEKDDEHELEKDSTLILRALLIVERSELDLDLWNDALMRYDRSKDNTRNAC